MPRITHDPTEEECPPYDDEDHADFREAIIAGHPGPGAITHEGAAEILRTAWQKSQDKKVARWNEQLQQDQAAREEEESLKREQELLRTQEQEREEGRARREAERKKPKINDFDPDAIVPGYIPPRPSSYALNKVKNLKYIELDYFTVKGCAEAQLEREMTSNHDTFGLTRLDNVAVFQPISSLKPSKSIRRDEELEWEEMVIAKNKMLEHMSNSGTWPTTHVKATMMLFIELENHPVRSQHLGNRIVVMYAARARRQWFDMIEQNRGFNLGKIGVDLMRSVTDEVRHEARQKEMTEMRAILNSQHLGSHSRAQDRRSQGRNWSRQCSPVLDRSSRSPSPYQDTPESSRKRPRSESPYHESSDSEKTQPSKRNKYSFSYSPSTCDDELSSDSEDTLLEF